MQEPEQIPEEESRTQRKNKMLALQKLGEVLVNLPAVELAKIPLEATLAAAIEEARVLKSHEGKRRQLQYIGRLMRNTELEPIQTALDKIQLKAMQNKGKLHATEQWRDQLIDKGDKQLQAFIEKFPMAASQELRQLVRNAQKDRKENKNRGHETALFRYLREIIEAKS